MMIKIFTKLLQRLTKKANFGRDITDIFESIKTGDPNFWYKHDYAFIVKVLKTPGASDRDRSNALKLLTKNFSGFPTSTDFRKRKIEGYLAKK
jgi:hypothetical protein